jgi:hypothetical protein
MSATETKQTHTPGPWELREPNCPDGPHKYGIQQINDGWTVADINSDIEQGEEEANARLIAAAPEMLEALEGLLSEMRDGQDSPSLGAMQKVYAAVCKAKGDL